MTRPTSKTRASVQAVRDGLLEVRTEFLATEEPLEIRLVSQANGAGAQTRKVAVTMRTPGSDFELAAGFLFTEGVIGSREEIRRISYCLDADVDPEQQYNIASVELAGGVDPDLVRLERSFHVTSACGVCGKASLDALRLRGLRPLPPGPSVAADVLLALPDRLRAGQDLFQATGGLHAAALFDAAGRVIAVREDVGRHNAMDKLIGWALLTDRLPLSDHLVMVSGRASFELVQKSLAAGIAIFCAVSAPSSLAVALAAEFGMTLVGFLRGERFNVYAGAGRINGLTLATDRV